MDPTGRDSNNLRPHFHWYHLLLLATITSCGGDDLDPCQKLHRDIQRLIDDRIENDVVDYPGVVAGVDTPDCGILLSAAGLAVVSPETPMQTDHVIPIASITKPFVAAIVMQLVQAGDLSLEDTLATWRPEIPNADTITVRQLLNHTSGIYNYLTNSVCNVPHTTDPDLVWTPDDLLGCIEGRDPRFDPGSQWEYSNTNYVLLGLIIEAVTGNTLHAEMHSRLLTPLGLDHTFFLPEDTPNGERAHCYDEDEDVTDKYHFSYYWACGNMSSNAEDLLNWIRQLLTGSVLDATTLAEMMTCGDPSGSLQYYYGLGLGCPDNLLTGKQYGHSGRLLMAVGDVLHAPDWDSSAVVLINHIFSDQHPEWPWTLIQDLFAIIDQHR